MSGWYFYYVYQLVKYPYMRINIDANTIKNRDTLIYLEYLTTNNNKNSSRYSRLSKRLKIIKVKYE
jgi:hypothetical protein